jgi:hypothetical protein
MLIKDLKDKYPLVYEAAMKNCDANYNENFNIGEAFTWCKSPEGHNFWKFIETEQFTEAEEICPHLFELSPEFKIGDWVYAEKQYIEDYRNSEYIPIFQIKDFNNTNEFLRPVKGESTGIHRKYCRLATQSEIDEVKDIRIKTSKPQQPYLASTTGISMIDIQAEAKRRFPIGCRFKNTDGYEYMLVDDYVVYEISGNRIWASNSLGCLYYDGKWAELINIPETVVVNMGGFNNIDYIDISTRNNIWVDKADYTIEIKNPTPLLLSKPKQIKQLVNLK